MHILMLRRRRRLGVALLTLGLFTEALPGAQPPSSGPDPLVQEDAAVKVSDHVFVIFDESVRFVPNVGIIVGDTATLVVDTGLGPRNGQTIVREAAKVSRNTDLYVVSTHFHPEHAGGEMAFPAGTTIVRARAQQGDIDELGQDFVERFSTFTPVTKELLQGVVFPPADILFDQDHTLDLGGCGCA
jgi:glyoxylase-like metal-dependent hydrolase (beta-lactamase superfamily II)